MSGLRSPQLAATRPSHHASLAQAFMLALSRPTGLIYPGSSDLMHASPSSAPPMHGHCQVAFRSGDSLSGGTSVGAPFPALAASPWETMVTLILARLEDLLQGVGLGAWGLFSCIRTSSFSPVSGCCSEGTGIRQRKAAHLKTASKGCLPPRQTVQTRTAYVHLCT